MCGRGRMPSFDDYEQMPFIRMCVKEVQRYVTHTSLSFLRSYDITGGAQS